MDDQIRKILDELISKISDIEEVSAIGISGKIKPYPQPGKGDFDIFIYCDKIPNIRIREKKLSVCNGIDDVRINIGASAIWGHGDYCAINKIDTFLMYFKKDDVLDNVKEILEGKYLWKINNDYFPIGRISMLSTINIFYDQDNFLNDLRESLLCYPEVLKEKMISYYLQKMLNTEDFGRAVNSKDVFFYHCTLDNSIEHFLMALFALNEVYFPSRKRSQQHIEDFNIKPISCSDRLLSIIRDGSNPKGIEGSYEEFKKLCNELKLLC